MVIPYRPKRSRPSLNNRSSLVSSACRKSLLKLPSTNLKHNPNQKISRKTNFSKDTSSSTMRRRRTVILSNSTFRTCTMRKSTWKRKRKESRPSTNSRPKFPRTRWICGSSKSIGIKCRNLSFLSATFDPGWKT